MAPYRFPMGSQSGMDAFALDDGPFPKKIGKIRRKKLIDFFNKLWFLVKNLTIHILSAYYK